MVVYMFFNCVLRTLIIVGEGCSPGSGFAGPGGDSLVLVAVVACHHFSYY